MTDPEELYDRDVPSSLFYAALGRMVANFAGRADPALIRTIAENRAVRTLEEIRRILNVGTLEDAECFLRIDQLVVQYFRDLEAGVTRHQECE